MAPRHSSGLLTVLALAAAVAATPSVAAQESQLPDLADTEITLSWSDFKSLVEATRPQPTPAPKPPTGALIRSAEYAGRLDRGVLTLEARLELEVLQKGWAVIPLWRHGAVLAFDGGGAILHREGNLLRVLARGPASYRLRATLVVAAPDEPGENRLALNLPDAPRNLLDLRVGARYRELRADAGLVYRSDPSRLFLSLVNGAATIAYSVPFERAAEVGGEEVDLQPRVHLAAFQLLHLGEGVISGVLVHDYQVRVAAVDHFDIDLPDGIEIFDVNAQGLDSWRIRRADDRRFLRLTTTAPVSGALRVLVTFEGAYPRDEPNVRVPRFAPREVEREHGFVAVAADGAEVELQLSGNLLPADVSEIPADVRSYGGNMVAALKYSGLPAGATATVTEHEDAAVLTAIAERLNATTLLLANGTEATWIDLTVKNNRKQFLRLSLADAEVEIWSLLVDDEPTRPKSDGADILVPLPTSGEEVTSRIRMVLMRQGPRVPGLGVVSPRLPRLDVPVTEALWTVYLPEGRRYSPSGEAFRIVEVTAPIIRGPSARSQLGLPGGMLGGPAMAPQKEADAYVSDETSTLQRTQQAEVQQQLKMRQTARRRGALPVRISVPDGVSSLPRLTVAAVLLVGDDLAPLRIRVVPAWIGPLLRLAQVGLFLGGSILLGLALSGVRDRLRPRWPAAALVAGLLPFGGVPMGLAVFLAVLCLAASWGAGLVIRHLARSHSDSTPGA